MPYLNILILLKEAKTLLFLILFTKDGEGIKKLVTKQIFLKQQIVLLVKNLKVNNYV
jgi:hypothetical protein